MFKNMVVDDEIIDYVAEYYTQSTNCKQAMTFFECLSFFCNGFSLEVIDCISTSIGIKKAS